MRSLSIQIVNADISHRFQNEQPQVFVIGDSRADEGEAAAHYRDNMTFLRIKSVHDLQALVELQF